MFWIYKIQFYIHFFSGTLLTLCGEKSEYNRVNKVEVIDVETQTSGMLICVCLEIRYTNL